MRRHPNRREVLAGISTLAAGGLGYGLATDEARANVEIGEFSIPDETRQVTHPVNGVKLHITAKYKYNAEKTPSRVVLRVLGTTGNEYHQLAAESLSSPLDRSQSGSIDFQANLLDLPNFEAVDLTPSEVGNSKSEELSIKLKMTVSNNGRTLQESTTTDRIDLQTTMQQAGATIQLGGSGTVNISEDTPTA